MISDLCGRPTAWVGVLKLPPLAKKHIARLKTKSSGSGGGGIPRRGLGGGGDGGGKGPHLWALAALGAHTLFVNPCFAAETKNDVDKAVEEEANWATPVLTTLGISGLLGIATGVAFKMVGRGLAVAFVIVYCILQGLVYMGVVDVHWDVVEKKLDLTGDEKFDEEDVKVASKGALRFLARGVPSVGGYVAGFFLGMRIG